MYLRGFLDGGNTFPLETHVLSSFTGRVCLRNVEKGRMIIDYVKHLVVLELDYQYSFHND